MKKLPAKYTIILMAFAFRPFVQKLVSLTVQALPGGVSHAK
jgi:hypothetical protein